MQQHREVAAPSPIVIVVDDDAAVRNSLKFSLEIEGFSVRTYASPNELLGLAEIPASACLVVDQNMPGMSGLNLLAALRRRGVRTPAVLMSAQLGAALKDEAARGGFLMVEKPFLGNALLDLIRAAMASDGD
jgi:two-component system response regulator FixJ